MPKYYWKVQVKPRESDKEILSSLPDGLIESVETSCEGVVTMDNFNRVAEALPTHFGEDYIRTIYICEEGHSVQGGDD